MSHQSSTFGGIFFLYNTDMISIAIDGYSSCGKSTLSKDLAAVLGYMYIDTGAMYRAVTLYILDHEVDITDPEAIAAALSQINIHFEYIDGKNTCYLNGVTVENEIRSMRVSNFVSEVAALPQVRDESVAMQRRMAAGKSFVMDGRDIGTVVFPDAEVKIFVTADTDVRTERRWKELQAKGKTVSKEDVKANLAHRDHIDSTREHSPLRQAADAYVLDNTHLSKSEQIDVVLEYIDHKVKQS